jgi:hypothetical protein
VIDGKIAGSTGVSGVDSEDTVPPDILSIADAVIE